jgi:ribosomal protein S18 acetylase RimI-like enzyme
MQLVPADQFSIEQLTDAYNQTRIDYIVPMPMNVARLREYIQLYDIDLSASWLAMDGGEMLGIGMLGLREDRAWISRLGVLPSDRRRGTGRTLMNQLLDSAAERQRDIIWLEVIQGNVPAQHLFGSCGFLATRELIVARRPPDAEEQAEESVQGVPPTKLIRSLGHDDALALLAARRERANWLLETESMANVANLSALTIELSDGGTGWVTYHASLFQLTQIIVGVTAGDPSTVSQVALQTLHRRHPYQDAVIENLSADDPRWPGYQAVGYFEAFRRIEMVRSSGR